MCLIRVRVLLFAPCVIPHVHVHNTRRCAEEPRAQPLASFSVQPLTSCSVQPLALCSVRALLYVQPLALCSAHALVLVLLLPLLFPLSATLTQSATLAQLLLLSVVFQGVARCQCRDVARTRRSR
jgi:hypothetical protein